MKILVLNGANLNLLGIREQDIYGRETYADMVRITSEKAAELGIEVVFEQSNHEGALVDAIQKAYFDGLDGIVFNPGAYTHTSIAIADAVKGVALPTVEVHVSDVDAREPYRQVSYIREVSVATVSGKGIRGYCEALEILKQYLEAHR